MDSIKRMSEQRFLDHIYDGYQAGLRFCFVLGAGASRTSGIRTGEQLMAEWRDYLVSRGGGYIDECARDIGLPRKEYADIFAADYTQKNEDYFTLFDLRFAGQPAAAFAFLEKEMAGKYPSYGYFPLAMMLANTENRLVITTNFDSLIEDSLFIYNMQHPLVVGHESLASYISNDSRRPVIAKIHRDLLFRPMNRKQDMLKLADEWKQPLSNALSKYIPIVIGYAGGDQTFMSLLEEIRLNGIFWCSLGGTPSERISRVVRRNNGYLVTISGFDELLFQIGERFHSEARFNDPCQYMREVTEKRCSLYLDSFERIRSKYTARKNEDGEPSPPRNQEGIADMLNAFEQFDKRQNRVPPLNPELLKKLSLAQLSLAVGETEKALGLCGEAIALAPEESIGYDLRSTVYHRMKRYKEALADADQAVRLSPDTACYLYSRGLTLHEMKQYGAALEDKTAAVRLSPDNAQYHYSRGITLHKLKRYEEALEEKTTAIMLKPENARYYNSRGITYHRIHEYEKALEDKQKAVALEPDNARYLNNLGATLHELARYDEALAAKKKATTLEPNNARYLHSLALTLYQLQRYADALTDTNQAIALEPNTPLFYETRSSILQTLGQNDEAERDKTAAARLRSAPDRRITNGYTTDVNY